MPSDGVCGNLLKWTPWGLVLALQWLTAMAVLSELAPALTEPPRYAARRDPGRSLVFVVE